MNGKPSDFGFLLAELALHGSKLYAERFNITEVEALNLILDGFNKEIISGSGNPSGNIES